MATFFKQLSWKTHFQEPSYLTTIKNITKTCKPLKVCIHILNKYPWRYPFSGSEVSAWNYSASSQMADVQDVLYKTIYKIMFRCINPIIEQITFFNCNPSLKEPPISIKHLNSIFTQPLFTSLLEILIDLGYKNNNLLK